MASTTGFSTSPRSGVSAKHLALGFVAGFVSVLVFHQLALGLLHLLGVTAGVPYNFKPTAPLGVPVVLSSAFWGGVWGILFALIDRSFPRRNGGYWIAALLFGAIALPLVAWFIVSPIKGIPPAGGWKPAGVATGILVNAAWGIGTAVFLRLLSPMQART